jgi:hypothetical protein
LIIVESNGLLERKVPRELFSVSMVRIVLRPLLSDYTGILAAYVPMPFLGY